MNIKAPHLRKTQRIEFVCTRSEKEHIKTIAKRHNLSLAKFIRLSVFNFLIKEESISAMPKTTPCTACGA